MPRIKSRRVLMAALGLGALGLAGCDDALRLAAEAKKGGESPSPTGTTGSSSGTAGISGQSACTPYNLGGDGVCLDVATIKQNASFACEKAGLRLNDYFPTDACGDGTYRAAKYDCCPVPPPPPLPPPSNCTIQSQGSSSSCKDAGTWKQYAGEACQAAGTTLTDYSPYEDCGEGGYRYVKYTCCHNVEPPPPPPGDCTTKSLGGDPSCKTPGTLQQSAAEDCAAVGAVMTGFSPYDECGFGYYRSVKYTCCPPEVPKK